MYKSKKTWIFLAVLVITFLGAFWLRLNKVGNDCLPAYENVKAVIIPNNSPLECIVDEEIFTNIEEVEVVVEDMQFLFFGDVMLDRNVGKILESKPVTKLLSGLKDVEKDYFEDKDIVSANLEGAVTNGGAHYAPVNLYDFAFDIDNVKELKNYNFNYLALANNHFLDQGVKGVLETRENLDSAGFYFSGAPDAQIDEHSRVDVEVNEKEVAMISLSMVYNHFDRERAIELVGLAQLETDYVIINIHWGNEYQHNFNVYQQEVGRALVEAGADLIIGHHPHVVQGMEIYQGKPIFYSLGNFVFDQYFSKATQEGLALEIIVSPEKLIVNFLPFSSSRSAPTFMTGEAKEMFLSNYQEWSTLSEEYEENILNGSLEIYFDEVN